MVVLPPPLVATYIEPLEQDLVVFTHPTPTSNRSGASGFELYKKL
jgi:hypothetical protein